MNNALNEPGLNIGPCSIPLQSLGVVDAGGTDIPDSELLAIALSKVSESDFNNGFAVKRGSTFVNEYARRDGNGDRFDGGTDDPNHLIGAFPTLFCFAKGGAEVHRPVDVSYEAHAKWFMQYADRRFRKHLHFMFQIFGVIQKRQICTSTVLQIRRKDFIRNQEAIRSLKPADLSKASLEEIRHAPFSNPTVRDLRRHVSAIRAKVMGTDESRIEIRAQIWSTIVMMGPPSLWITINPSDTNDPIAQVLAGAEIDLDRFVPTLGPDSNERTFTMASDPYAASEFFHYIIDAVLEELFGITPSVKTGNSVRRRTGIFGKVANYIGTVEAQGRGTLHLHMVLWLVGGPTSERMRELLKRASFRNRVSEFITANIKGDVPSCRGDKITEVARVKAVSYSRPVDPRMDGYASFKDAAERKLVRAVQLHRCTKEACLVLKKDRLMCKRNAPFDLSTRDWIDEDGTWGPKRSYGYVNNWCPAILHCVRSNHDIKLISNGTETKDLAWYITNYVAKKQRESSNVSALLAKRIAFHRKQEKYTSDMAVLNRRLLARCANTLSREQEFSAPEVAGYLSGKGDRKISGFYVKIYLGSFRAALKQAFPSLRQKR